jgi:diguanylate cyclase (GGDEF)-like protein
VQVSLTIGMLVQAGAALALCCIASLLKPSGERRALAPWIVSWLALVASSAFAMIATGWRPGEIALAFAGGVASVAFGAGIVVAVLELVGQKVPLRPNRMLPTIVALNLVLVPVVATLLVPRGVAVAAFHTLVTFVAYSLAAVLLLRRQEGGALFAVAGVVFGFCAAAQPLTFVLRGDWSILVGVSANLVAGLFSVIAIQESSRQSLVSAARDAEHMAYHDRLTGLPNQLLFFDRLEMALEHAKRHKHKFAVLFIDLDRFKYINDSLGHGAGDELLAMAARRLSGCVRSEDTVARFGGDEFIILLRIIGRIEDAGKVAQKIIDTMNPAVPIGKHEIVCTASVGISVYPNDGEDAEALVKNADTAMYRAKEAGRDAYRYYTPAMNARTLEILELESDLRRALARKQLRLHYQPLIDLEEGRIYGLEALLRWDHPRLGLLGPDRFIETAETTGLIVPIGEWVLREACRQIRAWKKHLGLDLVVSVNLSPRQFDQPDLVAHVRDALHESGLRPEFLELEITETNAMSDVEKTVRHLKDLKVLGVRVAIDDFGTGYSSLSYLKLFPIDTLKLDQSFVSGISVPEDGAIARGVIAMAHSLGLRVVAEGVETLGQLEFLKESSCDRLQGFLFSRPLDPENFERYLAHKGARFQVA